MARIVAGVDGGGTRTRVVLVADSGEILATGEAGSGNYHDVGREGLAANLQAAVNRAWESAALTPHHVDAVFLGLGSIVTAADHAAVREVVERSAWGPRNSAHIGVGHDLRIALHGCLQGAPGIVLIAGTGSSAYGRTAMGADWKAGGWGPLLDDVGSGHWLGRQAMIAAIRASDGRGEQTQLLPDVLDALKAPEPLEILRRVELEGLTRSEIAGLGRLVLDAAQAGDVVAQQVIERGCEALAELVATVALQLTQADQSFRPVTALTGGLISPGSVYTEPLRAALVCALPNIEIVANKATPVLGAAMLALESLLGGPLPEDTVNRLCVPQSNH